LDEILDANIQCRAQRVRLVVFDVDGVLTDGRISYTDKGDEIKSFHAQDGSAIERLMVNGIEVALISGRSSPMVERRADELGIRHCDFGAADKLDALARLLHELDFNWNACAYVGDDLPDIPALKAVGFAVSVPNAQPEVREAAHYITARPGGSGAASDVCRLLLRATTPAPNHSSS